MKLEEVPEQIRVWLKIYGEDHWLWLGAVRDETRKHKQPYVHYKGESYLVNRLMFHLATGFDLDNGLYVLHKRECNFSLCVNPEHLYAGTALDNARDRDETGNNAYRFHLTCKEGHTLSVSPTTGHRYCIACKNKRRDAWRKRKKDAMQTLPK